MISSARLRKSENALNHARPYMEQLQNILDHIASEINDYQSPLSQDRQVQRAYFRLSRGEKARERYKTDEGGGGYADPRSFRKKTICRRSNGIGR